MAIILDTDNFAFKDIRVMVNGLKISTLRGVTIKKSVDKEVLFGEGNKGQSIQSGNEEITGEVKVLQNDFEKLMVASAGDLLDFGYFNIVAVFSRVSGGKLATYTVLNAQFTEHEIAMEQGDKNAEITLPFIALDLIKT